MHSGSFLLFFVYLASAFEYKPRKKSRDYRGGNTCGSRGKPSRQRTNKPVFIDSLLNALCKQTAKACQRHSCTAACEIYKRLIYSHRAEEYSRHNIRHQYPCWSELCKVYQKLSHDAQCTSDDKSFHIFQKCFHICPFQYEVSSTACAIPGIEPPCCTIVVDISAPVAQNNTRSSSPLSILFKKCPHIIDAEQPQPEPPA